MSYVAVEIHLLSNRNEHSSINTRLKIGSGIVHMLI